MGVASTEMRAKAIAKESYAYYRTPRAQHLTSRSVFVFTDYARLMDYSYYAHVEDIAPRPILFIVGTKAATIFMSKAGYEKAAQPREWFEIPGATHHRCMTKKQQWRKLLRSSTSSLDVAYNAVRHRSPTGNSNRRRR